MRLITLNLFTLTVAAEFADVTVNEGQQRKVVHVNLETSVSEHLSITFLKTKQCAASL